MRINVNNRGKEQVDRFPNGENRLTSCCVTKIPEAIIGQAEMLTAAGDYISIHFDARAEA